MVGDVPDGDNRNTKFGVWPRIGAFDPFERVFRGKPGEDMVGVVERILEIFDQLAFCLGGIVTASFAVLGWLLALKFVEEGELGAGDVLYLFAEAADVVELASRRNE